MKRIRLLAVALVALLVTPSVALAAVTGQPVLSADITENRVSPGESTTLQVTLTNEGDLEDRSLRDPSLNSRVTTARGLKVSLRSGNAPIEVKTGTQAVGTLPAGASPQLPFRIAVEENAEPGTYTLPVRVSYTYTENVEESHGVETTEEVTERLDVTVEVVDEARFEVTDVSSSVSVGDDGVVSLDVTNVGTEAARDASVSITSENGQVNFGGTPTAKSYVGTWEPGETRTVETRATVAPDAERRNFSLAATVEYEDEDGVPSQSDRLSLGVTPDPEQTFSIENVESTLRVGDDGEVRGTVVNDGPNEARNVVLKLQSNNPTISPTEHEYAVADLAPNESSQFRFEFDVSEEADAGPRMLALVVRYRNADGDVRKSDPVDAPITVGPEEDSFRVEPVSATVSSGSQTTVELRVTNTGSETLTDIEAKLFSDDPLSSDNDEAFVGQLESGESTTVKFDVGAAGGIITKTYPVSVDFTYEDAGGDTELSDTHRVPIDVVEPEEGGLPWSLLAGAGVVVVAGLVTWKRNALRDLR